MTLATAVRTGPLDDELAFTETYRRCSDMHIALREAHCLQAHGRRLYPIQEGDCFAGRHTKAVLDPRGPLVGFGLEPEDSGTAYWCDVGRLEGLIESMDVDDDYRRRAREMLEFWRTEDTTARSVARLPEDVRRATSDGVVGQGFRLAGVLMDYDKLMRVGIPGLRREVEHHMVSAPDDGRDVEFYEGMIMVLDLLAEVCNDYADQADELTPTAEDPQWRADLATMAADLRHITEAPPETLRQGIQLFWVYSVMAGVTNFGRMDIFLGDLLARELDEGTLPRDEGLRLLVSLWRLLADAPFHFNARVVVGGRGRRNPTNADRFALLAMEASRVSGTTEPQLSLRFHEGQDPALMEAALTVIGQGCVYPILYNDDVNVPAVQSAFGVPEEDAEHYYPYGCGEYALEHISFGSPNSAFKLLTAVNVAMHNGVDPATGEASGPRTGDFAQFETFEQLWDAYAELVEFHMPFVARRHAMEVELERNTASFLYASMLYDHCLERGRSFVGGGTRYQGMVIESFGIVNAADSLTAVERLVYEEKRFTPAQVLEMLDANWEGFERERRMFLGAPKYGNDDDEADAMVARVAGHVCKCAMRQAAKVGFDYCLLVNINNFAHVEMGKSTRASADGRRDGEPMANGGTPTAGNDKSGLTAFLNSLTRVDPTVHAGFVNNIKFGKRMFSENRPVMEAALQAYWAGGGTQAMITVVGRDDLENAMREPEKYPNLIVRIGGFSARFVTLAPEVQRDIINRTFYG